MLVCTLHWPILLGLIRMHYSCGSVCIVWRLLQASNGQSELSSSSYPPRDIPSPPIKLAGLVLRRKEGQECSPPSHTSLPYKQEDYEVLLRRWTKTPYVGQLCMLSGPMVQGELTRDHSTEWGTGVDSKASSSGRDEEDKRTKGYNQETSSLDITAYMCTHTHARTHKIATNSFIVLSCSQM